MLKFYISILFFFSCLASNAQISKNAVLVGGQLSSNLIFAKDDSSNAFKNRGIGFILSLGKALRQNTLFGINLGYHYSRSVSEYPADQARSTAHGYAIGPYYRKYKTLDKKISLFGEAEFLFEISNERTDNRMANDDRDHHRTGGKFSLTPGAAYQLFKKLQIEFSIPSILSLSYTRIKSEYENPAFNDTIQEYFFLGTRFNSYAVFNSIAFGFRFYFEKRPGESEQ